MPGFARILVAFVGLLLVAQQAGFVAGIDLRGNRARRDPSITYEADPPIFTKEQALGHASDAQNMATLAASEVHAAAAQGRAAEAAEMSEKAELESLKKHLKTQEHVRDAGDAAQATIDARLAADESAKRARVMMHQIPGVAMSAAKEAVKEVIAQAIADMEKEARKTADEALAIEKKSFEAAAISAQEQAAPYQQAKVRAEKNVVEYVLRARELAEASIKLKGEAMKVAANANTYQGKGNVVIAQQEMMKAHDLMDKALQLEGSAKGFESNANKINGQMGLYGLAAGAAGAWAANQANPAGDRPGFPPLPYPLQMPPPAK